VRAVRACVRVFGVFNKHPGERFKKKEDKVGRRNEKEK